MTIRSGARLPGRARLAPLSFQRTPFAGNSVNVYAPAMKDSIDRREAIAALASAAALPLLSACSREPASPPSASPTEAGALALLEEAGHNLLRLLPAGAPSLGIDTGA